MKVAAGSLSWWRKYQSWGNWVKVGYVILSVGLLVAVGGYLNRRNQAVRKEFSEESFPEVVAGYSLQGVSSPDYGETCFGGTNPSKYWVAWYGTRRRIQIVVLEYANEDKAGEGLDKCAEATEKKLSRNLGKEVKLTREGEEKSEGFWQGVVAYPFGGEEEILYSEVAKDKWVIWVVIDGEENVKAKHEQVAREMARALDRLEKSE